MMKEWGLRPLGSAKYTDKMAICAFIVFFCNFYTCLIKQKFKPWISNNATGYSKTG